MALNEAGNPGQNYLRRKQGFIKTTLKDNGGLSPFSKPLSLVGVVLVGVVGRATMSGDSPWP